MTVSPPAASGPVARARDVPALLQALQASDPGRPRLTWYGPGGERVELSARVLANWVVKTANLLGDELGIGPGDRVALGLPGHWRAVVWQLALATVGAETSLPRAETSLPTEGTDDDHALRVGSDPGALAPGDVLVTLAALARAAPDRPAGVVDYNAEVGAQPDALVTATAPARLPPDPGDDGAAEDVPRVLVVVGGGLAAPLAEVVLPTLRRDGSLVLVHPHVDPEPLVGPEQVTRRWGGARGIS